jgi:glutathione S-transferase
MKLIIGNRAYSSWSMRGWLALKHAGLEFEELVVPLFDEAWEKRREGDSSHRRSARFRSVMMIAWSGTAWRSSNFVRTGWSRALLAR